MKKTIALLMSIMMVLSLSISTSAAESSLDSNSWQNVKYLPPDVEEITDEIIAEYGIISTDENGDETILIPLAPSNDGTFTPAPDYNPADNVDSLVHDGHTVPNDIVMPFHFSPTPHVHEIINLSSWTLLTFKPVTEYADGGFTISKSYNKSITIEASLNLNGGISKSAVEASLGVSIGGSYTRGESESYTVTVPQGRQGRIVYFYNCKVYEFTNRTTYRWPFYTTVEFDDCSAQGAPYNGSFALQLK